MLDAHAYAMQVKLCKANTRGVTSEVGRKLRLPGVPTEAKLMRGRRGRVQAREGLVGKRER